jgi:hypothetical protein
VAMPACAQQHPTDLCPDVLEAAPPAAGLAGVLAVASYQLSPDGSKTGSLGLLRASGAASPIVPLCSVPSAAVFDARWAPPAAEGGAPALLLSATHGGGMGLYLASGGGGGGAPSLSSVGSWVVGGGGSALSALCCEWLERDGCGGAAAAAGLSDGRLWVGALAVGSGGGGIAEGASWAAHSLRGVPSEVWCAAAKPEPPGARRTTLWSGGDDGVLRGWDLRAAGGGGGGATFATRAGAFGGGVTCVSWAPPWPGWEHVAAVGSYDGTLRLWDDRRVGGAAAPLAALPLGGGVWRVKWRDGAGTGGGWRAGRALAVAAMYGGARVVALGGGGAPPAGAEARVAEEYSGHGEGSITYGVEWVGGAEAAVATCAFYEKEVHVWV